MPTYEYAIANANVAAIDEALLFADMSDLIEGIVSNSATVAVNAYDALDAGQEATLDGIVAAYAGNVSITEQINAARTFGGALIDEYQLLLLSEGIASDPAAHDVAVAMALATQLAYTGDLVSLDEQLAATAPIATYLEQARIDVIRNRVRTYLGLPPI